MDKRLRLYLIIFISSLSAHSNIQCADKVIDPPGIGYTQTYRHGQYLITVPGAGTAVEYENLIYSFFASRDQFNNYHQEKSDARQAFIVADKNHFYRVFFNNKNTLTWDKILDPSEIVFQESDHLSPAILGYYIPRIITISTVAAGLAAGAIHWYNYTYKKNKKKVSKANIAIVTWILTALGTSTYYYKTSQS